APLHDAHHQPNQQQPHGTGWPSPPAKPTEPNRADTGHAATPHRTTEPNTTTERENSPRAVEQHPVNVHKPAVPDAATGVDPVPGDRAAEQHPMHGDQSTAPNRADAGKPVVPERPPVHGSPLVPGRETSTMDDQAAVERRPDAIRPPNMPARGGKQPASHPRTGTTGQQGTGPTQSAGTAGTTVAGPSTVAGQGSSERDAVVAVTVEGGVVTRVAVGGRPFHPFRDREGSHTTAWVVYGDAVRRSVVGHPPSVAAANLRGLIGNLTKNRPGNLADLSGLHGTRKDQFVAAVQRAKAALHRVEQSGANHTVELQDAIAAYLTARNLAPLANVNFGRAQAVGSAEAVARERLVQHETGGVTRSQDELRGAIWALFDVKTLTKMQELREQTGGSHPYLTLNHPPLHQTFPRP